MSCTSKMYIRLFPNTSADDSLASHMKEEIVDYLSSNSPGGYAVGVDKEHPNVSTGSDVYDLKANWDDYYDTYKAGDFSYGSSIIVSDDHNAGLATDGSPSYNAFSSDLTAAAASYHEDDFGHVVGIHEALHNFLADGLDCVEYYNGGYGDHELGKFVSGWYPTYMAYEESHTENGQCSETYDGFSSYYMDATSCTDNALSCTCNDAGGCSSNCYCNDCSTPTPTDDPCCEFLGICLC